MPTENKIRRFINGGAPALIKHVFYLLGGLIVGAFAMGLLYGDVLATGVKADENRERVEAIEKSMNELTVQQRVLIERMKSEGRWNAEFRGKTSRALERILERLPTRERPPR